MPEWLGLADVAAAPPDAARPIARRRGELLSHARFVADVRRWHAAFAAHGGARFALYFDDAYEFACALFGAWHAGKEAVLPGDAQPATLARLLPQVDGCAGELPHALQPLAAAPAQALLGPLDLQATRLVIFTSGSSGQPLAIAKRLSQLDAEIHHLQRVFGCRLEGGVTVYSTVSHQHIYGLLFVTAWPLAAGRAIEVERLAYPEQMAQRLAEGASVLVSSPAHLKRLPDRIDWRAAQAQLRAVFSSGGPLPPESAIQSLDMLGQSPIEVYGSSETGGVAWRQRVTHGDRWEALPGVDWRLQGDTLCVRSAHLGDEAWWETADRAQPLESGFMLMGRADRVVKVEEKRVSLVALEQALLATGEIAEARALLAPEETGARLAVVAVPSPQGWDTLRTLGKRAFNERLRTELLKSVERVALPRRFRYVREMPVNSQGKATEALLLALFQPTVPQARWREQGAERAVLTLAIEPGLRVFDGHFPGRAVLPGVAQLDWAVQFAGRCFPLPQRLVRIEQLKFQLPVLPPLQLELTLEWRADARQLGFRYVSERGVHSGGRLVFGGDDV
jgi:acyl-coenzyme A synthetase/AMP-(fatty) acid ligase/3-hydroxymyristoyl/3-hydroxydecanoyl-(acyl carrier protein) dehydratase